MYVYVYIYIYIYVYTCIYRKNKFLEVFLQAIYRSGNNFILEYQNNYVGRISMMSIAAKSFNILVTNLSVLHNYFASQTKLFSDLY